jgi:hypothetical protein
MRLPRPAPEQFLTGLALLGFAYLLAVGSGMDIDVEHDETHRWITRICAVLASLGVILVWLSLRRASSVEGKADEDAHPRRSPGEADRGPDLQ